MDSAILVVFASLAAASPIVRAASAPECAHLKDLHLPETSVTTAEFITPNPRWHVPDSLFTRLPGMGPLEAEIPFCRVRLVVEKEINVEIWLPSHWNSRFEGVGNGGLAGALNYPAMALALHDHFATASTDTGHITDLQPFQSDWIDGHAQRVIDFAYRAHHLMAERAKEVVSAFYGVPSAHNYFSGCSSGGWQGLSEAQRYPQDYDGILVGAPAINFIGIQERAMRLAQLSAQDPAGDLDSKASQLLVQAATASCDAQDGLVDGLISQPLRCHFNPKVLECAAGQTLNCLSSAQVRRAQAIYGPVRSPGGLRLYPGPTWGSAAYFTMLPATDLSSKASDSGVLGMILATSLHVTPDWTASTFTADKHLPLLRAQLGMMLDTWDPNLAPFKDNGGKMILYHGWSDSGLSPYNTLDYLADVTKTLGAPTVGTFLRTFMIPGMEHCGGGTGPNVFDGMTALVKWRERGIAPKSILASEMGAGTSIIRTRPLCPYPQVAKYKGRGDPLQAANFSCKTIVAEHGY